MLQKDPQLLWVAYLLPYIKLYSSSSPNSSSPSLTYSSEKVKLLERDEGDEEEEKNKEAKYIENYSNLDRGCEKGSRVD